MTTHALALKNPLANGILYLEIEGHPYAYGTAQRDSSWFNIPGQKFEGVRPWLRVGDGSESSLPRISGQRVDFINSRVSIGALRIGVVDIDGSVGQLVGAWRTDDHLRLATPQASPRTHASTSSTASRLYLRAGDAAKVAPGGWIYFGSSGGPRRVETVDRDADVVTVLEPFAIAPGLNVAVVVDRLTPHASASTFAAVVDTRTGSHLAAWNAPGVLYSGMEAMKYAAPSISGDGAFFTGVERGAYRSRLGEHLAFWPGGARDEASSALLTKYPLSMRGRRVWLKWGLDAASDAETITVFAGSISTTQWTDAGQTLVLECEDAQSWLRKPLFTDLADVPAGIVGTLQTGSDQATLHGPGGVAAEGVAGRVLVIGDRVIQAANAPVGGNALGARLYDIQYLVPSTRPTSSAPDQPVRAAILTGFSGVPTSYGAIPYTHPLELALAILTSTGSGTNGAYDTLPAGWGFGVPVVDINVAEVEGLIAENGTPRLRLLIDAPVVDARNWMIETLFKPFGFYLTAGTAVPIRIAKLRAPMPDEASDAPAINIKHIVIDSGGRLGIEGPSQENTAVLGSIKARFHPKLVDGKIEFAEERLIQITNENDAAAWQSAPEVEMDVWIGDNLTRDAASLAFSGNAVEHIADIGAAMVARFRAPPSILKLTCSMDLVGLESGQLVAVTLPHLPNPSRPQRGLVGELFEVWARDVDLARGVVVLELAQTNIAIERVRYLAPALEVSGGYSGATLPVALNEYTMPGEAVDTGPFELGDTVRIYSETMAERSSPAIIIAKTATSITLSSAVLVDGVSPTAKCHVIHGDYSEVSDAERQKWAYRAGSSGLLGGTDPPHVHS